jgi:hypothetical protein
MSTLDQPRGRNLGDLVRALIEEARRRARRRRLMYAGVLLLSAVFGVVAFSALQGPGTSASGSPAVSAGPGTPVVRVVADEHVYHGEFDLVGKKGSLHISLRFGSTTGRTWKIGPGSGWYRQIRGSGKGFQAGGHASSWYGRIRGFVTTHNGSRQRVVIELNGRPDGTYVLTPRSDGLLRRDFGSQSSGWLG